MRSLPATLGTAQAWATGLVLLGLVLVANIGLGQSVSAWTSCLWVATSSASPIMPPNIAKDALFLVEGVDVRHPAEARR